MDLVIAAVMFIALGQTFFTGSVFIRGGTNDREDAPALFWGVCAALLVAGIALIVNHFINRGG
jgi:hypothetical protein